MHLELSCLETNSRLEIITARTHPELSCPKTALPKDSTAQTRLETNTDTSGDKQCLHMPRAKLLSDKYLSDRS